VGFFSRSCPPPIRGFTRKRIVYACPLSDGYPASYPWENVVILSMNARLFSLCNERHKECNEMVALGGKFAQRKMKRVACPYESYESHRGDLMSGKVEESDQMRIFLWVVAGWDASMYEKEGSLGHHAWTLCKERKHHALLKEMIRLVWNLFEDVSGQPCHVDDDAKLWSIENSIIGSKNPMDAILWCTWIHGNIILDEEESWDLMDEPSTRANAARLLRHLGWAQAMLWILHQANQICHRPLGYSIEDLLSTLSPRLFLDLIESQC
jgi:hypothetical protein